jgi:MFS family permease
MSFRKDLQYYKFCFYGFLKNLRFFEAFFILFLKYKGLSYTEIGSLYAIREILTNLSEIPTGIIADTYGRKRALSLSFVIYIISFLLFYTGKGYWIFFFAFVLYGIADAFRSGTHKGMIMKYLQIKSWQDKKIDYYGHTRACSQRGSAVSSLIAGIIVFYSGNYQSIFLLSIVPYVINLFLILSYPSSLNQTGQKQNKHLLSNIKNLWIAIKSPEVLSIIHSAAIFTAYQKAVKDYIQPVMKNVALILPFWIGLQNEKRSGILIGLMYFILYLLTAQASVWSNKISKIHKIGLKSLIFGFTAGIAGGYFFHIHWWITSLIAFAIIYIVESLRKPILTAYLADEVPNDILTSVLSAQSLYRTLMTAVLSLTFGYLADISGLGQALFIISIFLAIISLFSGKRAG